MSANVERVLNEIRALTPAEIIQIRQKVDELLAAQTNDAAGTLKQKLFDAGLLSEIKAPERDSEAFRSYQPITVKGKPVSETIIEERR